MARRTKAEALATREHILDTAELVFEQRGVSRTSLNEIAQAAGLTRGAIYWHFDNKADLFHAMMQRVTLPMEEAAQRAEQAGHGDAIQQVRGNFIDILSRIANDTQVRRVFEIATHKVEFVDELLSLRERKQETRNAWLKNMEGGMAMAIQRDGTPGPLTPQVAALGLHALIDGLIRHWTLGPGNFDLVMVGTQVLDAYLAGLSAPPTGLSASPKPLGQPPSKTAPRRSAAARTVSRQRTTL